MQLSGNLIAATADVLVLSLTLYLLAVCLRQSTAIHRLGLSRGLSLLVFGLLCVFLLSLLDLVVMHVLRPLLPIEPLASGVLYAQWRAIHWLVDLSVLSLALVYVVRVLFPKLSSSIDELEAARANLAGELLGRRKAESALRESYGSLEVRVRERTNTLERVNRELQREIADRRHAEAALRESEERFRNLVEGSVQGIVIHRRMKLLFVNQAAARMLGYDSAKELLALGSLEPVFAPHERERLWGYMERRGEGSGDVPVEYEFDALRKDGSIITLQNMVRVVSWGGRPAVQATVVDVTKRRRAEAALRESEKRFKDFTAAASDFFWEMDQHLRFSYFSARFTEVTGVPVEELLGKTREETGIPGVDPEAWRRHLEDLAAHRPFRNFVHPRTQVDGRVVWLSINGVPVFDDDGEFRGYRGVGSDITKQREAEERLRSSEERFRDFAETAADWFWELDAELRFVYASGRFQEVMGVPPERLLGRSYEQYVAAEAEDPTVREERMQPLRAREPFYDLEFIWVRPDGGRRHIRSSGKPIFDSDGTFAGYRGAARDVTEAHELSEQLTYYANHDLVTGLVNRREFERRLQKLLDSAMSEGGAEHALCYLDLDQFKVINDTCGHVAGDEFLRQIGAVLQGQVRRHDTVARLGGDEFGVLLEYCKVEQARKVARGLRDAIMECGFLWEDKTFRIGASIGLVAIGPGNHGNTEVLRQADAACYAAKDQGRNRIHVYQEDDVELAQRHGEMQWVSRINQALEKERFRLYYQPIVPTAGGGSTGEHCELLLRMEDEDGREVPPGAFLPAAERYNLSVKIDRWVLDTAFEWLSANPERLEQLELCCINLSALSLGDEEFANFVMRRFRETKVPARKICFEITETGAIANLSTVSRFLKVLTRLGCRFALDDFGSGMSSYAYLKNLPVDFLKIDGTFVKDMLEDPVDFAMVRSINDIGHVMGKKTVAEFVENHATLEKLRELGVDYAQGFGIARPRAIEWASEEEDPTPAGRLNGGRRHPARRGKSKAPGAVASERGRWGQRYH